MPSGTLEYKRNKNYEYVKRLKDKVFQKLGNRCNNPACQWLNADGSRGCIDRRCLQIDHVFGNGSKDRKRDNFCHGTLLRRVLKDEEGLYQLLCANCNWIKRFVNREH